MTVEMIPWGVADDLVNDALTWALVHLRVETVNGEQTFVTSGTAEEVIGELVSAILVMYLRFRGSDDAKKILEQAAQMITRD